VPARYPGWCCLVGGYLDRYTVDGVDLEDGNPVQTDAADAIFNAGTRLEDRAWPPVPLQAAPDIHFLMGCSS
jgi:hypothetical protein